LCPSLGPRAGQEQAEGESHNDPQADEAEQEGHAPHSPHLP